MTINLGALARRAGLLFVTAAPGIQRLGFIAALSGYFDSATVGIVAGDIGICSFLALFAGGAVSGQALALWQQDSRESTQTRLLLNCLYWLSLSFAILIPLIYLLYARNVVAFPLASALFLVGLSTWQFCRTVFIAEQRVFLTSIVELITLILLGLSIAIPSQSPHSLFLYYGITLALAGLISVAIIGIPKLRTASNSNPTPTQASGFKSFFLLAINGIISTGRDHLTVPAVGFLADNSTAGIVAQTTSIISALLLIPRALVNHHLPILSKGLATDTACHRPFRNQMTWTLALLAALHTTISLILIISNSIASPFIALLAGLALLSNQLSLFASAILTMTQKISPIASSAFASTTLWGLGILVIHVLHADPPKSIYLLFSLSIALGIARAIFLEKAANRTLTKIN